MLIDRDMPHNPPALIEHLEARGVLKTPRIIDAFKEVDRKHFVTADREFDAYEDIPLPIGFGQTISQPYTVAFMLELLAPQEGEKILDVGSGSGWTTALLGAIVGPSGYVYGVELVPELVFMGRINISKYPHPNTRIVEANIDELGLPEHAPYDRILVSAGSDELPQALVEQLTIGGVMVIPIAGAIWRVTRTSETEHDDEHYEGFSFVPLIH